MKTKLSIREYFSLDKKFIIPSYQRGYKWGVPGIRNLSFHLINVVISGEFPAKTERLLLKYW